MDDYEFEADDPESRIQQLEREMKLLNWHKLANEAALKAAIIRTKKLKRVDKASLQAQQRKERSAWMEQIIREEQMKPLEVNTHFLLEYQDHERKQDERLEQSLHHHNSNLKSMMKRMVERDALKQKKSLYKKKQATLHAEIGLSHLKPRVPETKNESSKETGNGVLGSLGKLVELERRINNLESHISSQKKKESRKASNLSQLGMLRFRKKKIEATLKQPAKTMYAVSLQASAKSGVAGDNKTMNEWLRAKQDKIRTRNMRKSSLSNSAGKQISRADKTRRRKMSSAPVGIW